MQAQNRKELMNTLTMAATMYWKRACTAVVKKSAAAAAAAAAEAVTQTCSVNYSWPDTGLMEAVAQDELNLTLHHAAQAPAAFTINLRLRCHTDELQLSCSLVAHRARTLTTAS
jgi:hypothetical protein